MEAHFKYLIKHVNRFLIASFKKELRIEKNNVYSKIIQSETPIQRNIEEHFSLLSNHKKMQIFCKKLKNYPYFNASLLFI